MITSVRFIILFLLLSLGGQAQIIRAHPFYVTQPTSNLLLDTYSAFSAFSFRKLRTAYTGNCIQVRRKSDNTTQNIGFVNNYLDTASLKTFVGTTSSDTGFIRTWYDQVGSNDFINTVNGPTQPYILTSGNLVYEGGKIAILSDSLKNTALNSGVVGTYNFLSNGTKSSAFVVFEKRGTSANFVLYGNRRTTGGVTLWVNGTNQTLISRFDSSSSITTNSTTKTFNNNVLNLAATFYDLNNQTNSEKIKLYINGSIGTNNTGPYDGSSVSTGYAMLIFRLPGTASGFYNGTMTELIYFNTDQTANQTAIQNNINSFYSIY